MKVSDLVLYRRFDPKIHGITAEEALDRAVDGEIPAFYKVDAPVTLHGPAHTEPNGKKVAGPNLGKWHSITIQIPRGLLFDLMLDEQTHLTDAEGKPTALEVESVYPAAPQEFNSYLLWPEGRPIQLERDKLFFNAADLKGFASDKKQLTTKEKRTAAQIVAVLARMAGVDPDMPFSDDLRLETILANQNRKQIEEKIAVLIEMAGLASKKPHPAFQEMASIANEEGLELPSENTCVPWLKASKNIN